MDISAKISLISIFFSFFSGFQTRFYQMRWFHWYHSFKHSKWWCHKLDHTQNIQTYY